MLETVNSKQKLLQNVLGIHRGDKTQCLPKACMLRTLDPWTCRHVAIPDRQRLLIITQTSSPNSNLCTKGPAEALNREYIDYKSIEDNANAESMRPHEAIPTSFMPAYGDRLLSAQCMLAALPAAVTRLALYMHAGLQVPGVLISPSLDTNGPEQPP